VKKPVVHDDVDMSILGEISLDTEYQSVSLSVTFDTYVILYNVI